MVSRHAVAAVMLASLASGCQATVTERPVPHVRIGTGGPGEGFFLLAGALSRFYDVAMPGVTVSVDSLGSAIANLSALESDSVDLAFAPADVAYAAYARGTTAHAHPHSKLRGIAAVAISQLHVLVRADGPRTLSELRGRRIGYRVPGWDVSYIGMAEAGGFWPPDSVRAIGMSLAELNQALATGQIDAALTFSSYPSAPLRELAEQVPIRLLEIEPDAAMKIRARFPFYKAVVIPAGPYGGGQQAVRTIGVEVLMLGRRDLDEDLVYQLTKTLVESQSLLAGRFWSPMTLDPQVAPATPVPIHSGAARYFRERELLY